MTRVGLVALLLAHVFLGGCYLAHGVAASDAGAPPRDAAIALRDAGVPRPDAGLPPIEACEIRLDLCAPIHDAALQLFDEQTQSPELVWAHDRVLLGFWAPDSGPRLMHLDLEGRVLEVIPISRGYNETHLAWNPRTRRGLFSAESGLTWIGPDGRPTEEAWLSPDERFRGTFDIGPTEDGFAILLSGRGLETQLGTSPAPGVIEWRAAGRFDPAGPAVADRWTGELRAIAGGTHLRHDGVAWGEPVPGVEGGDFAPTDVFTFSGALYTMHYHYDGRRKARRWSLDGALEREVVIGVSDPNGTARLFTVGSTLAVVSMHLVPGAAIVIASLDPDTLEVTDVRFEVAPSPPIAPYNRHSIAVTETPRGLAVVWTEGPVGPSNLRPFLRLYECCVRE